MQDTTLHLITLEIIWYPCSNNVLKMLYPLSGVSLDNVTSLWQGKTERKCKAT